MNIYDYLIIFYLIIALPGGILASLIVGRRWWRPLLVIWVLSLATFSLWWPGPDGFGPSERLKPGLDLAGGTTLIYDVAIPKGKDPSKVIQDTIAILRDRVDPTGTRNLVWREEAGNRIEVQMPLATAETGIRRRAYVEARDKLTAMNLSKDSLKSIFHVKGDQRKAAVADLAKGNTAVEQELEKLATLHDQLTAAATPYEIIQNEYRQAQHAVDNLPKDAGKTQRKEMQDHADDLEKQLESATSKYLQAQDAYNKQLQQVLAGNITTEQLNHLFALSDKQPAKGGPSPRAAALQSLEKTHASRVSQIKAVAAAYSSYEKVKGPLDDPQDLEQLLRGSGVLEFRIAGTPNAVGDVQGYRSELKQRGPRAGLDKPWRWFPIGNPREFASTKQLQAQMKQNPAAYFAGRDMIAEGYNGQVYLLLGNSPETAMTRNQKGWSLSSASRGRGPTGLPDIEFKLNTLGGDLMGAMTAPNRGKPMAILLDNKVLSAPNLQSAIHGSGMITGTFSDKDIDFLVRTLKAGSAEGQLGHDPISITTTGSTLGQDQLRAGLSAAIWSLIIVGGFMAVYYFFAGFVADFALAANMVLILGVMALIHATFTLPGIAGVVLTIGMAVDANVLIYERIREEIGRNADVPTAVRLGYQKAFSTIVDANLTTLITCVVLGYTATADVKGFAVTLGVGILATLFTALFCTHVVMDLYVQYMKPKTMRMLPMVVPFVHRLLSPSVDWIGKRYIFMSLSGLAVVASLILVTVRGKDMLGIEFRSGTQVTFALKQHETLPIQEVRQRIKLYGQVGQLIDQKSPGIQALAAADAAGVQQQPLVAALEKTGDARSKAVAALAGNNRKLRSELATVADRLTAKQVHAWYVLQPIASAAHQRRADQLAKYDEAKKQGNTPSTLPEAPVDFALLKEAQPVTVGHTTSKDGQTYANKFSLSTLITDATAVSDVVKAAFHDKLDTTRPIAFAATVYRIDRVNKNGKAILGFNIDRPDVNDDVTSYLGGVAIMLKNMQPAPTVDQIKQRIHRMRLSTQFENIGDRPYEVIGIDPVASSGSGPLRYRSAAVVARDEHTNYQEHPDAFSDPKGLAATEWKLVHAALQQDTTLASVSNFNSQVSTTMENQALMAMFLSLLAVIIYVWFRFGRLTYGLAAIVALVHDVSISLGAVALSGWIFDNAIGQALLIEPFKINLALVAALLTIIGFSLNDTIVVFDRIRENRGRMAFATAQIINDSINQTISRTVLTSSTAMMAVVILYIVGGAGIHGFAFAMMIGVFVGTYSSIAIASPLLLIRPMTHHKDASADKNANTKSIPSTT